ncbi:MAG: tetratricopeptide repeat protein [bacterium]
MRWRAGGLKKTKNQWCRPSVLGLAVLIVCPGCLLRPWSRSSGQAQLAAVRHEIQASEVAIQASDVELAMIHLRRAVDLNKNSTDAHVRLGRVLNQQERWAEAKVIWKRATELDPDDAAVWAGLADSEKALGEFELAQNHYARAIDLAPHKAEHHLKMGEMQELQGHPEEAIESYFQCLSADPDHQLAQLRVARLQREKGQAMQAIVRLNRLLDLTPDQPEGLLQRGLAYQAQGQADLATADLKKASELMPGRDDIKLQLALVLETRNEKSEALKLVREVLDRSPELIGAKELNSRLIR